MALTNRLAAAGKGLVLLAVVWSCGEGPTKLDVKSTNAPPETYITSKALSKVPLETDTTGAFININTFSFTVEYTGVDQDGTVDSFRVRVDGGAWSNPTEKRTFVGTAEFTDQNDQHTVDVEAWDNEGTPDPTPATTTLSLAEIAANKPPTTSFLSGPTNGATTGNAVRFQISGADEDGVVASFVWTLDGGAEQALAADADGGGAIEFSLAAGNVLAAGTHTVAVSSVDNLGNRDASPAIVSFFVKSGFKPILTQGGGPPPGGGWFTGANIPFDWTPTTSHYFGVIDRYEYSIDDPMNFESTPDPSVSISPQTAGPHIFRLKAIDTGGNESDLLEVDFDVAEFAPTEGILFIDNASFVPGGSPYSSQEDTDLAILAGFFKNFTNVSVWDVDNLSGGNRFSGAINTTSLPGPADLAKYSSVVAMTDGGYALDDISPLLAAYFQAGGNLMITGYQSTDFGQVLKDVMGTPTVFNGFGTDFQSLEGFQTAGGNNSDAYAFITGADVVPVLPGVSPRSWEITTNVAPRSFRVMFGNVGPDGDFGGFRIATETQGEKGNWGLWIGVSMLYLDQTSSGIEKLGDFVLGTRFGEQ